MNEKYKFSAELEKGKMEGAKREIRIAANRFL